MAWYVNVQITLDILTSWEDLQKKCKASQSVKFGVIILKIKLIMAGCVKADPQITLLQLGTRKAYSGHSVTISETWQGVYSSTYIINIFK